MPSWNTLMLTDVAPGYRRKASQFHNSNTVSVSWSEVGFTNLSKLVKKKKKIYLHLNIYRMVGSKHPVLNRAGWEKRYAKQLCQATYGWGAWGGEWRWGGEGAGIKIQKISKKNSLLKAILDRLIALWNEYGGQSGCALTPFPLVKAERTTES